MNKFLSLFNTAVFAAVLCIILGISASWASSPSHSTLNSEGKSITPSPHLRETSLQLGKHSYLLEVTQTPEEAQLGLMGRKTLPVGSGMLFTFFPPEPVKFWMRHTLIPLDMIFVADSKIIHIQEAAPPCPEKLGERCPTYGPDTLVDYVIELPAHTVHKDGIKVGMLIGKKS
jgi:uncharacterized membrane protein (UPF0127 family)